MAHASNNIDQTQSALTARIGGMFDGLRARRARRRVYRTTFHELSALSNRELADLGLSRTEIRRVAYQAAHKI